MKIALQKYMHLTDGRDMVPAIRAALADCQPGDTLCLGGGLLHLYPEHTAVRPYYVSNNDYSEKHIAFDLQNRRDLTIDGEGAELLFHGHVTPFVLVSATNRLRIYALEYLRHTGQSHSGSMGERSLAYLAFFKLIAPCQVKSLAWRAFRAGITQSKKSTPRATPSMILVGVPTPIRYRVLSAGI